MTNNITPPPELVQQWIETDEGGPSVISRIVARAAQWGADQELEACCEWFVRDWTDVETADKLRASRRPKPPSLKDRALQAWAAVEAGTDDQTAMAVIRRALEALPND